MKRVLVVVFIVLTLILALYFLNRYWTHRFDSLIERQAAIYRVDPDLVWSIIYEETYFSPWKNGADGEIGLMQIRPIVGREWATETGMRELERQMSTDPQSLLRDPERKARFEREAQVLASLNHPNIASIYGLEETNGQEPNQVGLVMELVEGPTLADRLRTGPIAFDEALPIAKQIIDALEVAHERNIIHRDLKPANVKVTEEGIVKVLDARLWIST